MVDCRAQPDAIKVQSGPVGAESYSQRSESSVLPSTNLSLAQHMRDGGGTLGTMLCWKGVRDGVLAVRRVLYPW